MTQSSLALKPTVWSEAKNKMILIGIGIDLVEIESFTELYAPPESDLTRIFTVEELADCGDSDSRFMHLAGRFAAKEAALKALGCGLQNGLSLTDIRVVRQPSGAPSIELAGATLIEALRLGVDTWRVSITYGGITAAAVVIALSSGAGQTTLGPGV
jgi:holo-[acyl-carrier protein] synthase